MSESFDWARATGPASDCDRWKPGAPPPRRAARRGWHDAIGMLCHRFAGGGSSLEPRAAARVTIRH